MKLKPYVGITGFMNNQEVHVVLNSAVLLSDHRLIMVGVLASSTTLRGEKNKYPNRYPDKDDFSKIFSTHKNTLNLIHYSTDDKNDLNEQLIHVTQLGGERLHGLQLNIAWPDPDELRLYRNAYPDKKIVLQLGGCALRRYKTVLGTSRQLNLYSDLIDYVLIDGSGGKGKLLDTAVVDLFLAVLTKAHPELNFGIAGGLEADSLDNIKLLAEGYPNLSIDAEGRLRDEEDHLDRIKVIDYLWKANEVMSVRDDDLDRLGI